MGRQILHQEGHRVETASNGDEALSYLSEHKPDLVMLDTRMPGPSGYDVCELIKNSDELSHIKVVLLAGPLEPFDPAQAERVGSDAVLHKPLDAYSLIETVHSLIGKQTGAEFNEQPAAPEKTAASEFSAIPEELVGGGETHADVPGVPKPAANSQPHAVAAASNNPFDELVQLALDDPEKAPSIDADTVRSSVVEVLEASIPALAEAITQRIMARHEANKP